MVNLLLQFCLIANFNPIKVLIIFVGIRFYLYSNLVKNKLSHMIWCNVINLIIMLIIANYFSNSSLYLVISFNVEMVVNHTINNRLNFFILFRLFDYLI